MKLSTIVTVIFCFLLRTVLAQNNNAFRVQVSIEAGTIEGNYDTYSGIQSYLGIPYAKPPLGDLRWKAPQHLEKWSGVREVKEFGPRPMQTNVFGDMRFRSDGVSEDCLYLNVWTPAKRNTTGLPVLVYFYGGGFVAGDGSEPRYDGESMAKQGIVVVTVNYRLNIFGFFAHPELSAEAPYHASGNYGLLDQQAALRWVRANIEAFGGDPNKVTIAGESAGSLSVSIHMASPLSKELISGAIGESGASIKPTLAPVPLKDAEEIGVEFAREAGYPSLKQLRALSSREIYEIYNESGRFGFPTVIDGHILPKTLPEIFEGRQQAMVPLLLGWNSAEIPGTAFMQDLPYTTENFITKVKNAYPESYQTVLKLYPHTTPQEVEISATALASDRFIVYSTWKWFDLHLKHSDQPVYRYLYSKLRPPLKDENLVPGLAGGTSQRNAESSRSQPIGAPHACEIEYCLGNLHLVDEYVWTPEDYAVSATMHAYFANFIKNGDPNGQDLLQWPAADPVDKTPPVMIIDVECKVEESKYEARYEFLDQMYRNE